MFMINTCIYFNFSYLKKNLMHKKLFFIIYKYIYNILIIKKKIKYKLFSLILIKKIYIILTSFTCFSQKCHVLTA